MNSPYMGRFQITQAFTSEHDGLDLVGLDSKQIHSTVNGTVIHAGWENPSNHSQGFGLYVCIRVGNQDYYYGHMSQIYVSVGQTVKITDIIGLEWFYRLFYRQSLSLLLPCCRNNDTIGY